MYNKNYVLGIHVQMACSNDHSCIAILHIMLSTVKGDLHMYICMHTTNVNHCLILDIYNNSNTIRLCRIRQLIRPFKNRRFSTDIILC